MLFTLKLLLIIFYITFTPIFSLILEYPLTKGSEIYSEKLKISHILVPTAGIYKDAKGVWHPSSDSMLRIKRAELLAEKLSVPMVISGGYLNPEKISEANVMKSHITYKNTIYEINSKNSYETAINLKNVLTANNISAYQPLLLVTNSRHNLRMALSLRSQGYKVVSHKNSTSFELKLSLFFPDARASNNKVLYEYLAIFKYILKRYIEI